MAYAQLTWRESLRDVEATLGANPTKLYAMGLRQAVRRATLADANERRDWRIWADFAAVLIRRANKLYADEPLGLDVAIAGNVYALDYPTTLRRVVVKDDAGKACVWRAPGIGNHSHGRGLLATGLPIGLQVEVFHADRGLPRCDTWPHAVEFPSVNYVSVHRNFPGTGGKLDFIAFESTTG